MDPDGEDMLAEARGLLVIPLVSISKTTNWSALKYQLHT
jgi:hypothetical protein